MPSKQNGITIQQHQRNSWFFVAYLVKYVIVQYVLLKTVHAKSNGTNSTAWRDGFDGHGTTHEQMGQVHFPLPEYTRYKTQTIFSKDTSSPSTGFYPIYDISHFLLRSVLTEGQVLPPGYFVVKNDNSRHLGPKFNQNQWNNLLSKNWFLFVAVIFQVACIICFPFFGVCYCCLCCCRRCKQGCPPCTSSRDFRRRCCCGICLFLLVLGLIFGLTLSFIANKLLDRGINDTSKQMERATKDTCAYLKDVANHVRHIMVYNYQELETHINHQLDNANRHIFLDLADTADIKSVPEFVRIMENMPKALTLLKRAANLESSIRFLNSQLRDGMRGLKRDVIYTCRALAGNCFHSDIVKSDIYNMMFSLYRHIDELPFSIGYIDAIENIMNENYLEIAKKAVDRLKKVQEKVKLKINNFTPYLKRDLSKGQEIFLGHATNVRNLIDAVISDIHFDTLRSSKSYDDVYERFGPDRKIISTIVFVIIFTIIFLLVIALFCGCLGTSRVMPGPSGFCSKGMGASCLLIAIFLIFSAFSFIALVALFYLILGVVTNGGACESLKILKTKDIFNQRDKVIDLPNEHNTLPLRTSNAIQNCQANENIFMLLQTNNLYDVNDLRRLNLFTRNTNKFTNYEESDVSKMYLLSDDEKNKINQIRSGNLSNYTSILFTVHLENTTKNPTLLHISANLYSASKEMKTGNTFYALRNAYLFGLALNKELAQKLEKEIKEFTNILQTVDEYILQKGNDFNHTIVKLMRSLQKSEKFIQTRGNSYMDSLGTNLTQSLTETMEHYINRIINESNDEVGKCKSLAYIYHKSFYHICERLVDPINAFWLGLLLCAMLLIPIIFVAHRLMCLYLMVYPICEEAISCYPICTDAPIYILRGRQQEYLDSQNGNRNLGGCCVPSSAESSSNSEQPDLRSERGSEITKSKRKRE